MYAGSDCTLIAIMRLCIDYIDNFLFLMYYIHIYFYFMHMIPGDENMRTTIDLPGPLVEEAIKASHQSTKTAVIITALEEYVQRHKIQGLKKFKGKIRIDADLNVLRKRPNS